MQLPTTVTNPISAPPTQVTGRGLPWRTGAVLQAVVLEASIPGRVELQIGSQTISARTLFALSEGQVLSLRVAQTGELVILQPEDAAAAQTAAKPADAALAQQALREALPRQAALPPLLSNLTLLARAPERFPPALVDAARAALKNLPELDDVGDPDALEAHVRRSGLWLEATLASRDRNAAQGRALVGDWKAALLRLAAGLRDLTSTPAPASRGAIEGEATEPAPARPPMTPGAPMPTPNAERAGTAGAAPELTAVLVAELLDEMPAPTTREAGTASTPASPEASRNASASSRAPAHAPMSDALPLLRTSAPHSQPRVPASLAQAVFAADEGSGAAEHLLRQVEGALARVELGQLASLGGADRHSPVWLLELPVRARDGEADVLQLRIEQESAGNGAEEPPVWAVSLAFDLGDLGPMRARVAVRGEQVSTLFFAERDATVARVRAELGELEHALERRGLKVGSVGCRAGVPEPAVDASREGGSLLEVQA